MHPGPGGLDVEKAHGFDELRHFPHGGAADALDAVHLGGLQGRHGLAKAEKSGTFTQRKCGFCRLNMWICRLNMWI